MCSSRTSSNSLTVSLEAEAVVPLPCSTSAGAQLIGGMPLVSQTSVLLASAGQTAQLTVLVHWVYNPVDACILHPDICHCHHQDSSSAALSLALCTQTTKTPCNALNDAHVTLLKGDSKHI